MLVNKRLIPPTRVEYNTSTTETGFIDLPSGTTAQRPSNPLSGYIRINTDTGSIECYYNNAWQIVATIGWTAQNQINTTAMTHSIVNPGGTGLQGAGSTNINNYGAAAPSIAPSSIGGYSSTYFSTHGGHTGSNSYPMYWAVHLGTAKAVNQLICYVHGNSWGYFLLEGSNDSGNNTGFATAGTWTTLSFTGSNNGSNNQNMGGNGSGRGDGSTITFSYNNNTGYLAYRIKIIDSAAPTSAQGSSYSGSGGYSWQLNRV